MKLLIICLLLPLVSFAEVKFECKYTDQLTIRGNFEDDVGLLQIKSNFVFTSNVFKSFKVYRNERNNEENLAFAKFDNKTPTEKENKTWKTSYYRFSLPKDVLSEKTKQFKAYFGFSHTEKISEIDTGSDSIKVSENEVKEEMQRLVKAGDTDMIEFPELSCTRIN